MNKAGGYVWLHRQIANWEWYKDTNTKSLFIHLLITANFTDTRFFGMKVKRGQLITSLSSLSAETGLSVQEVKTALKHLISTNEITNVSTRQYRIITVVKFDEYNNPTNETTNDQQTPNKRPTNDQQYHNKVNNVNKVKKEEESKEKKTFTPPTAAEVSAYVKEMGYSIDPERFIDYYEVRGWVLSSGQKMKSWKAEIRLWQGREKNGLSGNSEAASGKVRSPYSFLKE